MKLSLQRKLRHFLYAALLADRGQDKLMALNHSLLRGIVVKYCIQLQVFFVSKPSCWQPQWAYIGLKWSIYTFLFLCTVYAFTSAYAHFVSLRFTLVPKFRIWLSVKMAPFDGPLKSVQTKLCWACKLCFSMFWSHFPHTKSVRPSTTRTLIPLSDVHAASN